MVLYTPVHPYTVLQSGVILYLSPGPCIIVFCVCPKTGLSYLSETFQTLWMCWCECLQKAHAICYHFSKSDGETGAEVIYLSGKIHLIILQYFQKLQLIYNVYT